MKLKKDWYNIHKKAQAERVKQLEEERITCIGNGELTRREKDMIELIKIERKMNI